MNYTLGWLHLSDLHFLDHHAWRNSPALSNLIDDLGALLRGGLRVDLVLCTGDIGFGETARNPLRINTLTQWILRQGTGDLQAEQRPPISGAGQSRHRSN